MGYQELIDALRKEGEEKVRTIWKEAEAEVQRIKGEAFKRIEEIRKEYSNIHSPSIKERTEVILSEAKGRARTIRLLAEKELSERLYSIAVKTLPLLRNERYKDIFGALIKELPPCRWKTVRVNPEDERIAKGYFQDSDIIPDSNIIGGLDVIDEDGVIHIVNTFEKRLERAWPEILPELIKDTYEEMQNLKLKI